MERKTIRRDDTYRRLASGRPAAAQGSVPGAGARSRPANVKEAKGTIKEVAGKLVSYESMEAQGKVEKTLGKAQATFGAVVIS